MKNVFDTSRYVKDSEKLGEIPGYKKASIDVMKIVWPAMLEGFLVALVGIFDGIMVAGLGNNAPAAVNITKQPIFFMICFITALNICVTAIVARRKGEGNSEAVNKTMHLSILVSMSFAVILSLVIFTFSNQINYMMGANVDTIDYANTYLRIIALGFIFNALRLTINACQRGMGRTKVSMFTNVIANLVNIFFNFLLIHGNLGAPALGIKGAAIATVIGNFVAFIICLLTILNNDEYLKFDIKQLFKVEKSTLDPIFKLFPSAMIEQAVMRVGFILFALIVNHLGTEAIYVHGVCSDINSLMFTLADGFAIGTSAIVGHKLGEKRTDLAIVYAKVSMTISLMVAATIAIVMVSLRTPLISLYKPETTTRFEQAKFIMLIAAFTTLPQNIQWVLTGILRGSGDSKFTAKSSLVSIVIVRPIVSYILCYMTPLGIVGAWIGMFIDQALRLMANIFRFKSRAWMKIRV